jgi:putative nucleotidyltransferase-like protein
LPNLKGRGPRRLTPEERKSLTHGDFWIPEHERDVYKRALEALNAAGVSYIVAGAYAIYEHTGIYRKTKDLDLFFEPASVVTAARALRAAGFVTRLEDQHWLAKATIGDVFVDLIYGMGNGVAQVDEGWIRHSRPGILAATPVRIAPPEELIWHRLFIGERHRHDMSDIVHLILCLGDTLDWERIVRRADQHWPLLLAQLLMFNYVYPGYRSNVPGWVTEQLLERARTDAGQDIEDVDFTRGPLISRFSFMIDVREWGFSDPRGGLVRDARNRPDIRAIAEADVWDERGEDVPEPRDEGSPEGGRARTPAAAAE